MTMIRVGDAVTHPEFGDAKVETILGEFAIISVLGERLQVSLDELARKEAVVAAAAESASNALPTRGRVAFRRSYEALLLGVVPPDPAELIAMTINGRAREMEVTEALGAATAQGCCRVVFGYYGAGKSHYLNFVRSVALTHGWVVAQLELDPAGADPAKPHVVYNQLMQRLEFPEREDGTRPVMGVEGLIEEVFRLWGAKNLRSTPVFKDSPWLGPAFETLLRAGDRRSDDFQIVSQYIAGAPNTVTLLRRTAKLRGVTAASSIQAMRSSGETSLAYVHNLAAVNALCRRMGYRGLCILLDEAEHFRNFSTRRRDKASNFFDLLGRAAHRPNPGLPQPTINSLDAGLAPAVLERGPHFALFVGLTQGEESDPDLSPYERSVLLHDPSDEIVLAPPSAGDYRRWCVDFLERFHQIYRADMAALEDRAQRKALAAQLASGFAGPGGPPQSSLRHWIKLAALVPATIFAHPEFSASELTALMAKVAQGSSLPWEMP